MQGGTIDSETQGVALGWRAPALSVPESKLCKSEFTSFDGWPFMRWLVVIGDQCLVIRDPLARNLASRRDF